MLPYIKSLKDQMAPSTQIDLLVREECTSIPEKLDLFSNVFILKGGRNTKLQLLHFLWLYPRLLLGNYDLLLDLQNHRLSRIMRFLLGKKANSVFDRTSPHYAGVRYRNTINCVSPVKVDFRKIIPASELETKSILKKFGLKLDGKYIVINPAGAFETRHWPRENYIEFCKKWLNEATGATGFIILGTDKVIDEAKYFKSELGDEMVDLVNRTTAHEAMVILSHVQLMISEDSGLFHMAYTVGTPSIGIFGSTRNDWTNPMLPHTYCFNSSDLPCGNCMREKCIHEEVICMTRVKPEDVIREAKKLLSNTDLVKETV